MEYWNDGPKKIEFLNPLFHYSNIPIYCLCVLRFLFVHPLVFMCGAARGRKSLIPKRRKEPQTAEIREDAERMTGKLE